VVEFLIAVDLKHNSILTDFEKTFLPDKAKPHSDPDDAEWIVSELEETGINE
jgi:hypothetical protein